ncbi:aminotransferase class I/II-fold pyridoxal phosphate-dependent enzyme [Ramlibacter tataouinensis]|uniref:histidinol-phosphate transaminase n=1 Tax=Ramlibacter tataouinensis (strain ATCC BAA-407 / DSM 14655 / LMG 21543 / TTB310) TaxID=365046 RepID=F5Y650_RAMTT|nr:aminotransferase class I/II-fold pyridoxal phosphate-dependent enzyme [Ramlibacter tataouinensis]AEG92736.1 Imidazole acetol- phosphate transaminase [Ramlibacter tataouinensis TTB310]
MSEHGGPDALGIPAHDFSTNANACGPCPQALLAVQGADARQYPDPGYGLLRQALAQLHQVEPARIVLAASASEFIQRVTAWCARQGIRSAAVPRHGYGDYARAARAWGLAVVHEGAAPLLWLCEPSSPLGQAEERWDAAGQAEVVVLDRAYEPLRLEDWSSGTAADPGGVWQLWTPNKALGLTGVRAAYAIAPRGAEQGMAALEALAPSWPLGAHGVALLHAWCEPAVQLWVLDSQHVLRRWKLQQQALCRDLGWRCEPSAANFFVAGPLAPGRLAALRQQGVKLRDGSSFGLPGQVRLSVQPPASQAALRLAWRATA